MPQILIVEDDDDLLYLYRTALGQAGYEVTMANTGKAAREALEKQVPQLVILDLHMPDVQGMEMIDYIRDDKRFDQTKIVVITANDQWQKQAEQRNIQGFLVKPVTIQYLVEVAHELTHA